MCSLRVGRTEKGVAGGQLIDEMLIHYFAPRHDRVRLFEYGVGPEAVAPHDAVILYPFQVKVSLRYAFGDKVYRPEHFRNGLEQLYKVVANDRRTDQTVEH